MAGVSGKSIKNRIRSMESTRQITRAMEMVASSKLHRAQRCMYSARPYFEALLEQVNSIARATPNSSSPYLRQETGKRTLFVVIAGDRGLAGGYNSNVFKAVMSRIEDRNAVVLPVGRKTADFFAARDVSIYPVEYGSAGKMSVGDCFTVAKKLCRNYLDREFQRICICYSQFESVLSQRPVVEQLLPLKQTDTATAVGKRILYEPDSLQVLERIVPEYLGGILYGALCESRASEQAARRTAMHTATENAGEMIDSLRREFNRTRQSAITQEITEIVAGLKGG